MSQNIYDNPDFFAGYAQLNRSRHGLEGAPEWQALCRMLPELKGLNIVDLGCGYGWFCRYVMEQGAARILGLDLSEKMLEKAASMTVNDAIVYQRADLENPALPQETFDLAYSSLTLHYIENITGLLENIYNALVPGGQFVFSMEHPIYTAATNPGWIVSKEGQKSWVVDHYQHEGTRVTDWISKGIVKQHRTLGTLLTLLIRQGFTLSHVEEWGPTDEQVAATPELAEERERPMLVLVRAYR